MKKCPRCNQVFADDNLFCLNDGTTLLDVSETGQSPLFQTPDSAPTQFISRQQLNALNPPVNNSKWLYLIIGVMATALAALGIAFFLSRTPTEKETAKIETNAKSNENVSNGNQLNVENKTNQSTPNTSNAIAVSTPRPTALINPNLKPDGRWTGDWNSKTTSFTAQMNLTDNGAGKFSGEIYWTLRSSTNPKKMYKTGSTATEYVQGTYNPANRSLALSGYRKDDPNDIVVLDKYNLILAENNQSLGGGSKSNGRFNLRR